MAPTTLAMFIGAALLANAASGVVSIVVSGGQKTTVVGPYGNVEPQSAAYIRAAPGAVSMSVPGEKETANIGPYGEVGELSLPFIRSMGSAQQAALTESSIWRIPLSVLAEMDLQSKDTKSRVIVLCCCVAAFLLLICCGYAVLPRLSWAARNADPANGVALASTDVRIPDHGQGGDVVDENDPDWKRKSMGGRTRNVGTLTKDATKELRGKLMKVHERAHPDLDEQTSF